MITGVGQKEDTPYHEFGRRLAERGYVVFAPLVLHYHPVEWTNDQARQADAVGMMRVSWSSPRPSGWSIFSRRSPVSIRKRIGYYGLSYGGYSTLWVSAAGGPAGGVVVSGHFNDWRSKITSDATPTSYLCHPDEDFYNWDVLHRFTHVELVAMMAPRPVCIEFGRRDGITTPEWTAYAWRQLAADRSDHLGLATASAWPSSTASTRSTASKRSPSSIIFSARSSLPVRAACRKRRSDGKSTGMGGVRHRFPRGRFRPGRFWMPQGARKLRGLALHRTGRPPGTAGDPLGLRTGERRPGLRRLPAERIADTPAPVVLAGEPPPVGEGTLVYYRLSAAPGGASGHYRVLGPRPLGGTEMPGFVAPFYRMLTDRPQDTLRSDAISMWPAHAVCRKSRTAHAVCRLQFRRAPGALVTGIFRTQSPPRRVGPR